MYSHPTPLHATSLPPFAQEIKRPLSDCATDVKAKSIHGGFQTAASKPISGKTQESYPNGVSTQGIPGFCYAPRQQHTRPSLARRETYQTSQNNPTGNTTTTTTTTTTATTTPAVIGRLAATTPLAKRGKRSQGCERTRDRLKITHPTTCGCTDTQQTNVSGTYTACYALPLREKEKCIDPNSCSGTIIPLEESQRAQTAAGKQQRQQH